MFCERIGGIQMTLPIPALVFVSTLISSASFGAAAPVPDQPTSINGVLTVSTGGSPDARSDSRWAHYPLHVEFVGKHGQFLGDETVNIGGKNTSVSVHRGGPWLLMMLPKGSYELGTDVASAGHKQMKMFVPGRVIVRFPDAGGSTSPTGLIRHGWWFSPCEEQNITIALSAVSNWRKIGDASQYIRVRLNLWRMCALYQWHGLQWIKSRNIYGTLNAAGVWLCGPPIWLTVANFFDSPNGGSTWRPINIGLTSHGVDRPGGASGSPGVELRKQTGTTEWRNRVSNQLGYWRGFEGPWGMVGSSFVCNCGHSMDQKCKDGNWGQDSGEVLVSDEDVANFVMATIPSVWALETLLLLKRSAPEKLGINQIVSALRSSKLAVSAGLDRLGRAGLIVRSDGEYRYSPASQLLGILANEVEKLYAVKPVRLINLIMKAKNKNLQLLANSFRVSE
jgi:hypothetical protein